MNFTPEQMNKAKSAKSADELLTMAKEAGIELTAEQAAKYFAELNKQGELNDDELTSVAGGSKGTPDPQEYDVQAGWDASGMDCGMFSYFDSNHYVVYYGCQCCGNCVHFKYDGELTGATVGKCRREFD